MPRANNGQVLRAIRATPIVLTFVEGLEHDDAALAVVERVNEQLFDVDGFRACLGGRPDCWVASHSMELIRPLS